MRVPSMNRWKWSLLVFELALFALILILPQVALPDFAFHRDTAPVTAKSSVLVAPVPIILSLALPLPIPRDEARVEMHSQADPVDSSSRLSLLCTLIC